MSPEAPAEPDAPAQTRGRDRTGGELPVMSFMQHLEELRSTLFWMLAIAAVAASGAWFVAPIVLDALIPPELGHVYFSSPSEAFMVRLKVSAAIGLLVALPLVVGRLWSFVAPGLFRHEKRTVLPVLASGSLLFYGGIVFAYYGVVPRMVEFFLSFSGQRLSPLINVTQYFGFVAKFCLAFGLAFQMPLVLVLLSALGLVTPQQLWSQWRYGVVLIFIVSAWLTPPDAVSQLMMGVPLVVLYMLSIAVSFLFARRRRRRNRA